MDSHGKEIYIIIYKISQTFNDVLLIFYAASRVEGVDRVKKKSTSHTHIMILEKVFYFQLRPRGLEVLDGIDHQ
jgi:hypothetical protein